MPKTKILFPFLSKREIVLRLTWNEAGDLLQQLNIHRRELKAEVKRLYETQEERGELPITDGELEVTEIWLDFTRNLHSRLLRIYRRYQKRHDKELAKKFAQEKALREKGEVTQDDIPF